MLTGTFLPNPKEQIFSTALFNLVLNGMLNNCIDSADELWRNACGMRSMPDFLLWHICGLSYDVFAPFYFSRLCLSRKRIANMMIEVMRLLREHDRLWVFFLCTTDKYISV